MTREQLIVALTALDVLPDDEAHAAADLLLLAYINDLGVSAAFNASRYWK